MQRMPKAVAFIEMKDGREFGPVRVGLKSKMQGSRTAKAKGWDQTRDAVQIAAVMAWHAAREAGHLDGVSYEQFEDQALDAGVYDLAPEDDAEPAEGDPTSPES